MKNFYHHWPPNMNWPKPVIVTANSEAPSAHVVTFEGVQPVDTALGAIGEAKRAVVGEQLELFVEPVTSPPAFTDLEPALDNVHDDHPDPRIVVFDADAEATLYCPPDVETATDTYDAGHGVNEGICDGCGAKKGEHVTTAPVWTTGEFTEVTELKAMHDAHCADDERAEDEQ